MFGKIYKEAVNECTPNYDLKKTLILKAAKKKRPIPVYKYSLSAAAVIILVVSAGFAGNYFDLLNNKDIEGEVITNTRLIGEEKTERTFSATEEVSTADIVSETEKPSYTTPQSSSVSDIAQPKNIQTKSDVESSKNTTKPKSTHKASSVLTDTAEAKKELQPEEITASEENHISVTENKTVTEQPELANKNTKSEQTRSKSDSKTSVDDMAVQETAEGDSAENYAISMASEEISSYSIPAATSSSAAAGGGGSNARTVNTQVWNTDKYLNYLGINLLEKVSGTVSATEEKEITVTSDGELSDDEWTFKCGNVVIVTTKNCERMSHNGQIIHINGVDVYKVDDEYQFVYNGACFKITGSESGEDVIRQILN